MLISFPNFFNEMLLADLRRSGSEAQGLQPRHRAVALYELHHFLNHIR